MNVPGWFGWIFVVLLGFFSVIILSGKGDFLIAGYNTTQKVEKERYHKKRLRSVVGGGFSIITMIIALIVIYDAELPQSLSWLNPYGILGVITVIFLLSNTICKKS